MLCRPSSQVVLHQVEALIIHAHTTRNVEVLKVVAAADLVPEVSIHGCLAVVSSLKRFEGLSATVNENGYTFR